MVRRMWNPRGRVLGGQEDEVARSMRWSQRCGGQEGYSREMGLFCILNLIPAVVNVGVGLAGWVVPIS